MTDNITPRFAQLGAGTSAPFKQHTEERPTGESGSCPRVYRSACPALSSFAAYLNRSGPVMTLLSGVTLVETQVGSLDPVGLGSFQKMAAAG